MNGETAHWYQPSSEDREVWEKWVAERPENVRRVAEKFPPWTLWRLDHIGDDGEPSGRFQRVYPESFQEHDDGSVSMTIIVSGDFNLVLFERQVFGIEPESLKPTSMPDPEDLTGSSDLAFEAVMSMMQDGDH